MESFSSLASTTSYTHPMFPLSSKRLAFHQILWQVISSDADLHSSPGAVNKPVSALNADATPRRPRKAPQIHKAPRRRVPLGFFDNVPRPIGASSSASRSQRTSLVAHRPSHTATASSHIQYRGVNTPSLVVYRPSSVAAAPSSVQQLSVMPNADPAFLET